ncbi:MAG: hypothetical protein AAFT19_00380 [Pseudomonadota bacterium]
MLAFVRKRPAMYLGENAGLRELDTLIAGYGMALNVHGIDDPGWTTVRAFRDSLETTSARGPVRAISERAEAAGQSSIEQFFDELATFRATRDAS